MADTPQQEAPPPRPKRRTKADLYVKVGFAVVLVAAIVWIYFHQRGGPSLDWPTTYREELQQARQAARPVVLFLQGDPPSLDGKEMVSESLTHSQVEKYLREWGYVRARTTAALGDEICQRYDVAELPALVILSRSGEHVTTKTGFTGHAEVTALLRSGREAD